MAVRAGLAFWLLALYVEATTKVRIDATAQPTAVEALPEVWSHVF